MKRKDILLLGAGAVLFGLASLDVMTRKRTLRPLEINLFRFVNRLPSTMELAIVTVMQLGSLGAVPVVSGLAALARRFALARGLALSGMSAWLLAKLFKVLIPRERPMSFLEQVMIRGGRPTGMGFPSGHATVAAAMATAASHYFGVALSAPAWVAAALVALGRVYVGAHFPIDIIGGFGLGVVIGAAVNLRERRALESSTCIADENA